MGAGLGAYEKNVICNHLNLLRKIKQFKSGRAKYKKATFSESGLFLVFGYLKA